ncbi:MAG TPA: hypothetical protein PKB13_11540, partial [Clostridia bacterium]|nr:hypothetical protein [Clostridia bacterium]
KICRGNLGGSNPPIRTKAMGTSLRGAHSFGCIMEGIRSRGRTVAKTLQRSVFSGRILCQAAVRSMECKQGDADAQNPNSPIRTNN